MHAKASTVGVLLAVGLAASGASATTYDFTTLDAPGATATVASGIDDLGRIVGSFTDASGNHGFAWDGTTYATLDFPGATTTDAGGINDGGAIAGTYTGSGKRYGFVKEGATYRSFEVPPEVVFGIHFDTYGRDINDAGVVVGQTTFMSDTQASYSTYWVGSAQAWNVFLADSFTTSGAFGINDAGQIVGFVNYGYPGTQAYLLDAGILTTFAVPDAGELGDTLAYGTNDAGQIVGLFYAAGSFRNPHGFVKEGDSYAQLDVPEAAATVAHGINDSGWIVGSFRDSSGVTHGFLATPVPEPTTLALIGSCLAVLLAWRRQRSGDSRAAGTRRRTGRSS